MANVKISQLPSYTGNTSGSWLVMNNSGETTTYKVQKETLLSGFQPSGNYATTGSNVFKGDQNISGSVGITGSLYVSSSTLLTNTISSVYNNIISSGPMTNNNNLISANGVTGYNKLTAYTNILEANTNIISGSLTVTGSVGVTGSLNVSGNISAVTSSNFRSVTFGDSFVGALGTGNLYVPNGYVNTPAIFAESAPPSTGTLDIFTHQRLSLTASIGDVNISAGQFGGSPKNIRLTSAGGTINSGSLRVIGNTTITGSLTASGSIIQTGSLQGNVNTLSISSNTASLNLDNGNFFTLQLVSGSATHLNPSNIKPGQTVSVFVNTIGSATMTFPSSIKQISGSSYTPSTGSGLDILTLISKDSSNLYLVNAKNFV